MFRPAQPLNRCPCGIDAPYADCCGRYLDAGQLPATAEALMRSRYVAYVQRRSDYLLQTWHPSTRPGGLDFSTESGQWLGLKVLRVEKGRQADEQGTVEFIARYKIGGKAQRLHEVSRFIREGDEWVYLDAEVTL